MNTSPKAYVFDVDGVLKAGPRILPFAVEVLTELRDKNIPFVLMTNAPFLYHEVAAESFREMGLPILAEQIHGSADPLRKLLAEKGITSGRVYSFGLEDPTEYLLNMNLVVDNHADPQDLEAIIIFDDDYKWTSQGIADIFNMLLKNQELPLIIPNPDPIFPVDDGFFMVTSGSVASWIVELCRLKGVAVDPIFLGKPYAPLYEQVYSFLEERVPGISGDEICMIGDTPAVDIRGARNAGWQTILVKTGNYRYGAEDPQCLPDREITSLEPLLNELKDRT